MYYFGFYAIKKILILTTVHCQHYSDKITVLADMRIKTLGFHGEKKLVKILANTAMNGICYFLVHFFFVEMAYKVHLNGFMLIVFYVVEIIRFLYLEITSRNLKIRILACVPRTHT